MQRSLWIGGFAVGALLGTIVLESRSLAPAPTPPTSPAVSDLQQAQALEAATPAQSPSLQQRPSQPSAFEWLESQVAASQRGRISVGQIMAIARITRYQPGAPTFEQLVAQVAQMQGGRISIAEMLALRGANAPPATGYRAAPVYPPPFSQNASATLLQSYYARSTPYQNQELRGESARAADEAFENRRSSATYPSAAATSPPSPSFPSPTSQGLIDTGSGQYMAPAAGGYTDPRDGTFYAQSGPNGVVNTRTGEFVPTH